jgi:uncharacterized protein YchJ
MGPEADQQEHSVIVRVIVVLGADLSSAYLRTGLSIRYPEIPKNPISSQTSATCRATVEFVARSRINGRVIRLHELSSFVREAGPWYYLAGIEQPAKPAKRG